MIQANNVTLRVGKKALFEDVNIKFTEGNCYGLIGANGAGKSTFLKILSGQLDTTNGTVSVTPGQRLSFLEQDHFKYDGFSVMDTVIMGNQRLYDIMQEKDALYAKPDFSDEDGIRASELEAEFADMDGWEAESSAASLLNGLGIDTEFHYELMKDLVPHIVSIHGKIWEMTEIPGEPGHYEDASIDYVTPFKYLKEGGYEGYVNTEYEGQRHKQDQGIENIANEVEEVRRHHEMMRRLIGE